MRLSEIEFQAEKRYLKKSRYSGKMKQKITSNVQLHCRQYLRVAVLSSRCGNGVVGCKAQVCARSSRWFATFKRSGKAMHEMTGVGELNASVMV